MKCPNCGRFVRSKTQCAHCGYVFGSDAIDQDLAQHNDNEPDTGMAFDQTDNNDAVADIDYVEPGILDESYTDDYDEYYYDAEDDEDRSRGGVIGKVLKFLVQLVLVIALLFGAFFYGPTLVREGMALFGLNKNKTEQHPQEESHEESVAEQAHAPQWTLTADASKYPLISITMKSDGHLPENIRREAFQFAVQDSEGTKKVIDNYSLATSGSGLVLGFYDSNLNNLAAQNQKQQVHIDSEELNIHATAEYQIPDLGIQQDKIDKMNSILHDTLGEGSHVSAFVRTGGQSGVPYVNNNQTKQAGTLISWFILEKLYHDVEAGKIKLDDHIKINKALLADGYDSPISQAGEGTEYVVSDLVDHVIQEGDLTAMNHLIQAIGGPNEFNMWLNQSQYLSTRIENLLSLSGSGQVTGAVTSPQDVGHLLDKLASNQWVSAQASQDVKERLLKSPETAKFPAGGIKDIKKRYELITKDTNPTQQYYSGILESESGYVILVLMANDFGEPAPVVDHLAKAIQGLATYSLTGEVNMDPAQPAESTAPTPAEQPQQPAVQQPQVQQVQPAQQAPQGQQGGSYPQYVPDHGYVTLPDHAFVNEYGQRVEPKWFFDQQTQQYRYTY